MPPTTAPSDRHPGALGMEQGRRFGPTVAGDQLYAARRPVPRDRQLRLVEAARDHRRELALLRRHLP